jgi:hypothetical protein
MTTEEVSIITRAFLSRRLTEQCELLRLPNDEVCAVVVERLICFLQSKLHNDLMPSMAVMEHMGMPEEKQSETLEDSMEKAWCLTRASFRRGACLPI